MNADRLETMSVVWYNVYCSDIEAAKTAAALNQPVNVDQLIEVAEKFREEIRMLCTALDEMHGDA